MVSGLLFTTGIGELDELPFEQLSDIKGMAINEKSLFISNLK
jgi:hypothetical protein